MMVLVDTSVLIDYLRGADNAAVERFQRLMDSNLPFGISPLIYFEVLQGARTEKDFTTVKSYLETHRFFSLQDEKESYAAAARIYFECRRKGITINSTVDCLIAQTAIENDLALLHHDADFDRMRKVAPLKIYT
ncbi:MAG: PIN domain nuclease [Nitrospiraceae bacterium]|nr:PIN domain nuclease [Nitrospiraceae bacterium]